MLLKQIIILKYIKNDIQQEVLKNFKPNKKQKTYKNSHQAPNLKSLTMRIQSMY